MTSREAMIETINRAYKARDKGDLESVMSAFHPNAVFELKGEKDVLEIAGPVQGHQSVRAAMAGFIAIFEFMKRDIVETMVDGDRVAVHSRLTIRFVPRDVVVTTDLLDRFRFEDGKIIELVEFADTALIKSLVSP
ncbi:MAG TPA: nuclear transport factor 2 family protein [Xanthobacteraceae bacterium]|jgi:ketosteroid isomerase-like protein